MFCEVTYIHGFKSALVLQECSYDIHRAWPRPVHITPVLNHTIVGYLDPKNILLNSNKSCFVRWRIHGFKCALVLQECSYDIHRAWPQPVHTTPKLNHTIVGYLDPKNILLNSYKNMFFRVMLPIYRLLHSLVSPTSSCTADAISDFVFENKWNVYGYFEPVNGLLENNWIMFGES